MVDRIDEHGDAQNIGQKDEFLPLVIAHPAGRREKINCLRPFLFRGFDIADEVMQMALRINDFLVGLFLDNWLGTLPWITIALMFLAFAGACIHVIRMNKDQAR